MWCVHLWNGVCEECMYVFVWYVCNIVRVYVCGVCVSVVHVWLGQELGDYAVKINTHAKIP